jgi:hypothetical protein
MSNRQSLLFQTANLEGGSPLRWICWATNELKISQGVAPHVRHYTCCWFLDHDYKMPKHIPTSLLIAKSNIDHGDVLLDSCVLVLFQFKGKVKAMGVFK